VVSRKACAGGLVPCATTRSRRDEMAAVPSSSATGPMSSQQLPRSEVSALIRQVNSPSLYNRQLSSVCQVNGLKSTGVKAELQRRITTCKYLWSPFGYLVFPQACPHFTVSSLRFYRLKVFVAQR
jgi:hypothetical protein